MEKLDDFTKRLGNCGLFRFFDAIQKWILVLTGVIVFVLTIATVFLRYVLTMNVLGLDEIILIVIFWQYFIGAAQGSREDSQIKADMVSTVVKNKAVVAWCHLLARIIECGVIGVCIKWSVNYILKDMSVMPYTVVLSIPLVISHAVMLVGFALMLLYHVYWLLTELVNVCALKKEKEEKA
jgi:TRAP-type C4-dicarboxylate transport system permease small subunit